MQTFLCGFQQLAVVIPDLFSTPFGMTPTVFGMYVCAALLSIICLIKVSSEVPRQQGVDKIMPFGRLFFAIPMAVFASEHFTATASIAGLVPRWIPAHTFWVY